LFDMGLDGPKRDRDNIDVRRSDEWCGGPCGSYPGERVIGEVTEAVSPGDPSMDQVSGPVASSSSSSLMAMARSPKMRWAIEMKIYRLDTESRGTTDGRTVAIVTLRDGSGAHVLGKTQSC